MWTQESGRAVWYRANTLKVGPRTLNPATNLCGPTFRVFAAARGTSARPNRELGIDRAHPRHGSRAFARDDGFRLAAHLGFTVLSPARAFDRR